MSGRAEGIGAAASEPRAFVIPTDEELLITRDASGVVSGTPGAW